MQPGTYSLERSLEDCINDAIQKAVKNPCGKDPFDSALRTSMDTFALNLPVCLQQDGITTRETLPAGRNVSITSVSNKDQNQKTSHPLISAVDQGVIILNQPIFYTVKKGDTLSDIGWKLTGRRASVHDLKNWNTIWDDNIKPGKVLFLADPYDSFVKEIASRLSKHELTGRNPKISLDRLSDEMVARHGGLFGEKHQVEIQLSYMESWEEILSPEIFVKGPGQDIPKAPELSVGNVMGINGQSQDKDPVNREMEFIGIDTSSLDPSTLNRNIFGLHYPGGNNPQTFPDGKGNRNPDYSQTPLNHTGYPAIGHDRRYDNLGIAGAKGLFTDTRAIGADWQFVLEELFIASNPFIDLKTRVQGLTLGLGLGYSALVKSIIGLSTPQSIVEIIIWYQISNIGVSNSPTQLNN